LSGELLERDAGALLGALADPLVAADGDERIVYANAAAERLFGWAAGELRGQAIDVLLPERLRGQHPPYLRNLLDRGATPARAHAARKDGAELDVELSLSAAGPLLVASARAVREEPKISGDERYRLVFEHAPVGLLHWDAAGIVTDCNEAMIRIVGSSKQMAIGLNLLTLQGDPTRDEIRELIRLTFAGKPSRYDGPYISQTGEKTTQIQAVFAPIVGSGGVVGGLGIVEDVTERKRTGAALARADRLASIGSLAAGVAHEINNPLVYVTLGLELIGREIARLRARGEAAPGEEDWERIRSWCADALEGAERVRTIVGDLQALSRAEEEPTARFPQRQPSAPPAPPDAVAAGARRARVLLIDDEAHLGVTLRVGLREQADLASVRSGREAVTTLLADDAWDLILCDLMMPDLTGMDVFEQVVGARPALRERFVFMTGAAVTERARRFLDDVPGQRLDKPFRLEQVEALLRRGATPS
jgi:PAS domain S-box-containing protein